MCHFKKKIYTLIGSVYTTPKSETNPIFFGFEKVDPNPNPNFFD